MEGHVIGAYPPKIAFSAKEYVIKCLYPATQRLIGFTEISVELDLAHGRYRAAVGDRRRVASRLLDGRFVVADGHLFTALSASTRWPTSVNRVW
jgi:4'-phosphopantetheinyl transferase EntD